MLHTQCLPFTLKTTCLIQTDGNYVKCTFFGVRAGPDFAAPNLFDLQWMVYEARPTKRGPITVIKFVEK